MNIFSQNRDGKCLKNVLTTVNQQFQVCFYYLYYIFLKQVINI